MFVKIAKIGAPVKEVAVEDGTTVGEALRIAEIDPSGYKLRLNRVDATVDTTIHNGEETSVITLLPAVKGGK